jgi:parallel beta-helix repeat protein
MRRYPFAAYAAPVLVCFALVFFTVGLQAATFTVTNTNDSGAGSLRQAILDANGAAGADVIVFSIGAGGAKLIAPLTLLPSITQQVTLDATTQPGYSGKPLIGIDGSNIIGTPDVTAGLNLQAAASVVTGFSITRFRVPNYNDGSEGAGVIVGAPNCTVKRSYLGVALDGVTAGGNDTGVRLDSYGDTIGAPGEGNVLSAGNTGISQYFGTFGAGATQHIIQNNYIGLDASGTTAIPNTYGVFLGAPALLKNNVVAGNRYGDAFLTSANIVAQGNRFGVNAIGQRMPFASVTASVNIYKGFNSSISSVTFGGLNVGEGNEVAASSYGIYVTAASSVIIDGNNIHDNGTGIRFEQVTQSVITGNIIHNNYSIGLQIASGAGNVFSANSFYGNYGGIQLGSSIPLANDPGDTDGGSNLGQNYPLLTTAKSFSGATTVTGTLNSAASSAYRLEFFSSPSCSSFGYGEGKTFIGGLDVTTDPSGNVSFTFTATATLPTGSVITATATDAANNTSEFSACASVQGPGVFSFSSSGASVSEGSGSVTLTVLRTGGTIGAATLNYATASGTATAGSDFTSTSGTLSFADGESSKTITIPILEDNIFEGSETFSVALSSPTNGTALGNFPTATVTIIDNDPGPTASINDISVVEGNSGTTPAVFTVTLSAPAGMAIPVNWYTYGGSAYQGSDFVGGNGTITFAPGETSKTITVAVSGDTEWEGDEYFYVQIYSYTVSTTKYYGIGTIKNDDAGPTLSINDVSLTEGDSGTRDATFTVTLSQPWPGAYLNIAYSTKDGTARAGSDYQARSGSVTIGGGQTWASFSVPVIGDKQPEGDEVFAVQISVSGSCCVGGTPSITKPVGQATILNDDVGFGPSDQRLAVGQTISYFVQLGAPKAQPETIKFDVQPSGVVDMPASIIIPAGESGGNVKVTALKLGNANITATMPADLGGGVFAVVAEVLRGGSIVFDPADLTVAVGSTVNVSVSIDPPASDPVTVTLVAVDPAVINVPASIVIPAGGKISFALKALKTGGGAVFATLPLTFANTAATLGVVVIEKPTGPSLLSVSPSSGPMVGGTSVTLAGANLTSDCSVTFGGIPATSTYVDPSTLTAMTPAHVAGAVGVTLTCGTTLFTLPNAFTYLDAAHTLTAVSPSFGGIGGGTLVKLTGTNFHGGCWPFFDGTPSRGAKVLSPTSMTASTPPHALGGVDVAIRCGQVSYTLPQGFSYSTVDEPAPVVTGIDPLAGPPGQSVTITGVRFRTSDVVTFGTTQATVLSFAPDTIVVRVPELPLGKIAINVTDDKGHVSTTGPIFTVIEPSPPQITSLKPSTAAAGAEIAIEGTGFRPAYKIAFGGKIAAYVSLDYTHAIVRLPQTLAAGTYAAEVWNANNQTASIGPSLTVIEGGLSIGSLSPRCATTDGNVSITINGTGFASGASVTFNGLSATNVTFLDAQTLKATAPANAAGSARVVVTNPNGGSASMSDSFRYDSPFDPDGGCATGSKRRTVR